MALTVATNTGALMAQAAASSVNKDMEIAMERLSTGKRINSASDDAAGVAIASRLTSEIKGINQSIRNAMDGQAMIDTAEGALDEVVNLLQRMRELAVQAANDTNSSVDRTNLDLEFDAASAEITRIEASTTWAGVKLLDGSGGTSGAFSFLVGTGASGTAATDTVTHTFADLSTLITAGGTGITDNANADAEILLLDTSIAAVNSERAKAGSFSNRLDSTVSNLTNISNNLAAGKGRIEDADFAAETTSLAKSQILQQASTAMLAQANASKQNVLSLLQG
ncbi:MAG: flagellin [Paracoccaceae bacterium]|jgi:flagellin|nr:flagellin [Paracoccaceae bacterium]